MKCHVCTIVLLVITVLHLVVGDDYYDLLGINRQATQREIRKAFKKLAISLHPDKNKDDPEAHEKFLKINRAYEVLKDEEMRKKYDMYGEEGLKEDGPSGGGYKSWNFYQQDFGIYDDDPEIITLSRSDFEQSVHNTEDIWFVNYYSPHCSHCHDLAPSWREVARELEGVVRIGAVNCEDDWMLCRSEGIRSYPSLIMYPMREMYHGVRNTEEMVRYALRHVKAQVVELWDGNLNAELQNEEKRDKPWLITFCGDGGDCLEKNTCTKLAAMLAGLVNVGMATCYHDDKLCKKLSVGHGTYYYEAGKVEKGKSMEIFTLDTKEVAFAVLSQLPDVTNLDQQGFEKAMADLKNNKDTAWLIHFTESQSHDLELRKLPVMLESMHVGRVDCRQAKEQCKNFNILRFPSFAMFKPGGHYEIHHGRLTAHDIAAFARDSASNQVTVLGPSDFPSRVVNSGDPWFVDFYAPWCPPCMRLLPEFRKASKAMGDQVHFGTVDCTVHQGLCHNYNIHSYPTTIFYNNTQPHQFHGHHNSHSLVEFIQDTLHPPVISLDDSNFDKLVKERGKDEMWLVDFFAPWCGPCQQLAPEWRALAKTLKEKNSDTMMTDMPKVKVGQVDCQAQRWLCQQSGVQSYPTIRLYPIKGSGRKFVTYNEWFRDAQSIKAWAFEYLPSQTTPLEWETFNQDVLGSQDAWLVDFYAPWCGHCRVFAPEFERIATALEDKVHAGKVNCDDEQWLCQQAGIRAYPTLRFYKGAPKADTMQSIYGEDLGTLDANYVIKMLQNKVKNKIRKKDEL